MIRAWCLCEGGTKRTSNIVFPLFRFILLQQIQLSVCGSLRERYMFEKYELKMKLLVLRLVEIVNQKLASISDLVDTHSQNLQNLVCRIVFTCSANLFMAFPSISCWESFHWPHGILKTGQQILHHAYGERSQMTFGWVVCHNCCGCHYHLCSVSKCKPKQEKPNISHSCIQICSNQ